tara:strand:- start:11168 stop:12976 length:1809 start_codon:yes stop_codon:yes gene_type:complete
MASTATIEDLAQQLTEVSDKFVDSFVQSMTQEDELTKFLRGRQRWYVGTKGGSPSTGGSMQQPERSESSGQADQNQPRRKKKCPKPKNTTVKSKVDMGKVAKVGGLIIGIGLIVGGIALALADGPQPGPADAAALPIIIQGANKIVPFVRTVAPVLLAKGGYVTKPTRALVGEAGPEIIVPMHKFGETIKDIYKQSANALLAATAGFLSSQPNNPSKGKLMGEVNKLKNIFGLGALKIKQSKFGLRAPIQWWNKGRNERVIDENNASWGELLEDDMAQRGQSDEGFEKGEAPPLLGRPDHAFNPFRPAEKGGPGSGPTPAVRQAFERPVRGLMNLGKSAATAIGIKKSIPVPSGLGEDMFGNEINLNPSAASGWKKAVAHAARDGINLPGAVTSAFRSNAEQAAMVENEDDPSIVNALPVGQSPHQKGWSVDIAPDSPANQWMRKHGKQYGFNWEGPTDPVHFDFQNNEDRGKFEPLQNNTSSIKTAGNVAKKFGVGNMIKGSMKAIGNLKLPFVGDPEQVEASDQINPPQTNPQQEAVNEQPVNQTTKNGDKAVIPYPIVIPSPTQVVIGPSGPQQLDPDIQRHYVVDTFSKATRVEVAYV